MFYIKTRLNDDTAIEVNITHDNVCCRCPRCGAEVPVDLETLTAHDQLDLQDSLLCKKCSEAALEAYWKQVHNGGAACVT